MFYELRKIFTSREREGVLKLDAHTTAQSLVRIILQLNFLVSNPYSFTDSRKYVTEILSLLDSSEIINGRAILDQDITTIIFLGRNWTAY